MADYNSSFTGAQIDAGITLANSAQQPPSEGPFVNGDKTKLDGIEAGADVTDTANVTAAGALMDSEVTNLAAVKAFDPTDYATSAQGALADTAVQPGDDANTLGSGAATDGYVLTADGAGGTAWEEASGGGSTDYVRTRAGAIQDLFDMADTWNGGVTTFTAIKMNVTDTASASDSLLMDLQVDGTSKVRVKKSGLFETNDDVNAKNVLVNGGIGNASWGVWLAGNGNTTMRDTGSLNWTNGVATVTKDLRLFRDAANTLAQRNGTNAQTFNIYNTYTDASNYERGFMKWDTNVLKIGTEKAETGTARALELQTDGTTRLTIASNGNVSAAGNLQGVDVRCTNSFQRNSIFALYSSVANRIVLSDATSFNTFDLLQFGGVTSSYPAIKRSTTSLQARLADDSAFTNIQGKLTTETAYTAGVTTATGYIVLYDSTGTAYKVPAEAL